MPLAPGLRLSSRCLWQSWSLGLFHLCAIFRRQLIQAHISTELKGPNVCNDSPPIMLRQLIGIRRHRAKTLRYHLEEVSCWGLAQPGVVKRSRRCKTAPHYHSLAGAQTIVAWRTKNFIAFLAPRQHFHAHLEWKVIDELAIDFAIEPLVVLISPGSWHGARHD